MVTHIHPDHYGLAGRIREASGAWVALHPADAALIIDRYDDPEPPTRADGRPALPRMGAPADEIGPLQQRLDAGQAQFVHPGPARRAARGRGAAPTCPGGTCPVHLDAGPLAGLPVLLGAGHTR